MVWIKVEVPDGEYCKRCRFLIPGTILCGLFDEFVTENDDNTKMIKCESCPRE